MTKGKKTLIIVAVILCIMIGGGAAMFIHMGKVTKEALAKQVNVVIDMDHIKDGKYIGESDGGMVKVKVAVTVKDHAIAKIDLLKHDNGKGKPAEAIIPKMVKKNTDNIDVVSGATASSKTIRNAVNKALQKGM